MDEMGRRKICVDLAVGPISAGFGLSFETLIDKLRASMQAGNGDECLGIGTGIVIGIATGIGGLPNGGCIFLNHSSTSLGTL